MLDFLLLLPIPYRKKRIGQLPMWLVRTSPGED